MAGRDELFLRLYTYKVSKKNLGRKVHDREATMKPVTVSMKQLARKEISSQDRINLLHQLRFPEAKTFSTSETLAVKSYRSKKNIFGQL